MDYKYTGIILGKRDIGEADRIYSIYTLEAGKIQAKAIGVRKPGAKLAGALENFTLADISVVKKQGMGKITGSITENNFSGLKGNFDALALVFEAVKIFDQLVGLEEKDKKFFNLLLEYLETVDNAASDDQEKLLLINAGFIFKLLNLLGYKIEVNNCVHCGSKLNVSENFFNAEQGGIACKTCASKLQNNLKVSPNAIKLVRIFFANNLKSLAKLKVGKNEVRELNLISQAFLDWIGH